MIFLQPATPEKQTPTSPTSPSASGPTTPGLASPTAPALVLQRPRGPAPVLPAQSSRSQVKPPELVLPEDSLWDIYVTHIFSTVELCVRLLGDEYSSKFEDLITDMELHYFDSDKVMTNSLLQIQNLRGRKDLCNTQQAV